MACRFCGRARFKPVRYEILPAGGFRLEHPLDSVARCAPACRNQPRPPLSIIRERDHGFRGSTRSLRRSAPETQRRCGKGFDGRVVFEGDAAGRRIRGRACVHTPTLRFERSPATVVLLWDPFKALAANRDPKAMCDYEATLTLTAMFLPPSSRYVTSALALTLSLPSIAVFLSTKNVIVLGSACCVRC